MSQRRQRLQVKPEAGVLGDQVASEAWASALLTDGALHTADTAVGEDPASADKELPGA